MEEKPCKVLHRHREMLGSLQQSVIDLQRVFELSQKEMQSLPSCKKWKALRGSEYNIDRAEAFLDELTAFYDSQAISLKSVIESLSVLVPDIEESFDKDFWAQATAPDEELEPEPDPHEIPF